MRRRLNSRKLLLRLDIRQCEVHRREWIMAAVGDIGEGLIVVVEQRLLSGILAGKWGEHSTCLAFAQLPLLSPPFPPRCYTYTYWSAYRGRNK